MRAKRSRAGIERKILTSILWVGILPMTFMLISGYITARGGQSNAVQQTLLTATETTAEGIQLLTAARLRDAERIACDPDLIAFLLDKNSSDVKSRLLKRLKSLPYNAADFPTRVSIYDPSGMLRLSTHPSLAESTMPDEWLSGSNEATFRAFGFENPTTGFWGLMVAPIPSKEDDQLLGYVTVRAGVNSLVQYAVAGSAERTRRGLLNPVSEADFHQIVYRVSENVMVTAEFVRDSDDQTALLVTTAVHPSLLDALMEQPSSGTLQIKNYEAHNPNMPEDVLLAFSRVSGGGFFEQELYLVAYRPTSAVFSAINTGGILAVIVCVLGIAFLCVNAYRDVHNNIVQPLSLLNEGAQIVRQGDFDLKLKIGTGDEIEELATSFNKMAVALKQNMRQLEESEEKYRTLITSMRDGLYQTDQEGRIAFLNPAGMEILGFLRIEDAIGTDLQEMFVEELDFKPFAEEFANIGSEERARFWLRRRDGRTICVELSRNPVLDNSGMPVSVEGIIRDVTKNVRLEEEARERSERISAINQIANVINSSLEAGRLYDSLVGELKKLVDFDYAAVALLSEEGLHFDGRQFWPDEEVALGYTFTLDREKSCAGWVARERTFLLVDDLTQEMVEFADQFPDNARSCLCVPLYASGSIIGTLNLGSETVAAFEKKDVESLEQMAPHIAVAIRNAQLLVNLQLSLEEVTRAREKLHEANEELKTLDEMKTNLLSNVSHELRTPLVSIMGYTDMILNEKAGPITKTQREYLNISLRNVDKLVTLIENLLDFSKLHRGDERLVFNTFDIVECARTSAQIVQPVAESQGVTIELNVPSNPITVEGDRSKMGQVFNNLLSNAVKFNGKGGQVEIRMELTSSSVDVSVTDTGIGIPQEALDKIFTRFYQYDASSTRKYGGTGIGLSIAQDIVRLHGSSIHATSEVGKGSTFQFSLLLAPTSAHPGQIGDDSTPTQESHVLIELLSRDHSLETEIRNILYFEGLNLIQASRLDTATALAKKHRPDCLVVDLRDPERDENMIEKLLNNPYTGPIPIILLTNNDEFYEKYRKSIATRLKPGFRKSSFLSAVHHALNRESISNEPIGDQVLCVDDDDEILKFMGRCLESEGIQSELCTSGEEAMRLVATKKYGLVLLDIAMPGMDGWETCTRIKSDPQLSQINVFMVTAKPIDQNLQRMRESGSDGFLQKPFRPEDLIQLVRGLELHIPVK